MQLLVSHPTGNRNVRAVITALLESDMLIEFDTTLSINAHAGWLKLLPGRIRQELLRRTFDIPSTKVRTHPNKEVARIVLPKIGLQHHVQHEKGWASVDAVYQDLDQAVARRLPYLQEKGATAVYAYEDGALATFTRAKALGMQCLYDLPIAYWETGRRLMLEEAIRLPQWAPTLGGGIQDSAIKLERKTKELELADVVIGPGKFVMDSLPSWAKGKHIIMSPFGSPAGTPRSVVGDDPTRPLRVLFVGAMGQRKGLGDLFAAAKLFDRRDIELIVMGTPLAPMEFYRGELPNFTYEAGRPHDQVLDLMRSCDVFCLPSIVEGRALVMQEAMSQGLPLIITPNTGGEDLIKEGQTGFLIPIRSPQAIAEKLQWFLDNRAQLPRMIQQTQAHAASYTWQQYGADVLTGLMRML